jgi:arylsulfatase A-like enzyme
MRWKGKFPKGLASDGLVVHFDIFSTILEAASVAVPQSNGHNPVHGVSLMKHILSEGKVPLPERTVFWELTGKVAARRGRWKIVGSIENPRGRWERIADELSDTDLELYDLESDISESQNLRENFQEQYASLKEELISFFRNIR